jgi:tRNA pseudouridine38-40 synthase
MPRFFIEVAYKGNKYSGFQIQENANSVQAEVEKAMSVFLRRPVSLTGSSRTDTGVHALQNFFHLDWEELPPDEAIYHINAILPDDIAIRNFFEVAADAHCRFDASWREYQYKIYPKKDPFLRDRAFYFPYPIHQDRLIAAADMVMRYKDFSSFCKRNTQAKTSICTILASSWTWEAGSFEYRVRANRFLRGMVRGLVGTMLQVGRGKISVEEFADIIESGDNSRADFSVPGYGLYLVRVEYPVGLLK